MKNKILPFALLAVCQTVFSQQPPNAGSQLQQIPAAPVPQRVAPAIRIEPGSASAAAASDAVKIVVNSLQVTGALTYPEAELVALTGFQPGSELTLADLRGMASKITERYRSNGFFIAPGLSARAGSQQWRGHDSGGGGSIRQDRVAQPEQSG